MIGQTISHYRVLEKIGEGGMGEVYLAEDSRLGRKVALKFLPQYLQQDEVAQKRFVREARSAAAIDHPYICKIYEPGETEDYSFIAMEYVEGDTLQKKIDQGRVSLKETLHIAFEIAEALEEAHEKGIVHRDLKPANIMQTAKGHIKVMDFGLAKRLQARGKEEEITAALTREGTTLGTLTYMSPEQLRGQKVDTRSDIFSFGVMLYEMLTGVHPFRTGTQAETINSILNEHPSAISRYTEDTSDILEHTVEKMLAKKPAERYQLVHEVRTNLKKLYEKLSVSGVLAVDAYPKAKTTSWVWMAAAGVGAVLVALAVWTGVDFLRPTSEPVVPLEAQLLTALTGQELLGRLNPNATHVVFAHGERASSSWLWSSKYDLYLKRLGAPQPTQLTLGPERDLFPVWSPNGSRIAFTRESAKEQAIYLTDITGSPDRETKLAGLKKGQEAGVGLSWHPDGEHLAFVAKSSAEEPESVYLLSVNTPEKEIDLAQLKRMTSPPDDQRDFLPEFSPDGRWLAFGRARGASGLSDHRICVVPVNGGEAEVNELVNLYSLEMAESLRMIRGLTWTSDSREIVFSAGWPHSPSLWRVASTGEDPRRISQLPGEGLFCPHISGGHLIYSQLPASSCDIWSLQMAGGFQTPMITSAHDEAHPDISPDGKRVAFVSTLSGEEELWTCEVEKCDSPQDWVQLTDVGYSESPCWSPDGQWIAFTASVDVHRATHVIREDGSDLRRVTESRAVGPSWSRDGNWIYFYTEEEGIFKIRIEAGEPKGEPILVVAEGKNPMESMDGRFLYFWKSTGKGFGGINDVGRLHRVPVEGGQEEPILDNVVTAGWDVADKGIYYFNSETEELEIFDVQSGERSPLGPTSFPIIRGYSNRSISVAPGEEWLIYASSETPMDVMLVENFR